MVGLLRRAAIRGELPRVTRAGEVDAVLDRLMATEWVVYTKNCLNHTGTVVEYLARYSHRIAITNARLLAVDDAQVTFRYKDYRDGSRHKTLSLDGTEFVRRFLLHVKHNNAINSDSEKRRAFVAPLLTAGYGAR